jgi:aspartokinase/homoserine dehydrogenase 1
MKQLNLRNSVYIDCTADPGVASTYTDVIGSYISVVTPNKIACSSDYAHYRKLKTLAQEKNVKFIFETNVGAGLR